MTPNRVVKPAKRSLPIALVAVFTLGLLAVPVATAAPEVTSITPTTGPVGGGTNIIITGTGFVAGATVTIGGAAATGVVVNSATEIVATTPAKPAGTYNLAVTLPDTTTYTEANAFTYAATPTITTITPPSGPTAGGTVVTILGTNFRAGLAVTFGGTAGTAIVVNSETEIVVTTPAKTAGKYAVVVTNSDTSTYTKPNAFQYGDQPTITAITPATVGTPGGASVQVTGTNFRTTGTTLTVGGTAFTGITVNSPTELVATAPAKAEGTYNVVVTVDGLSYAKANALSYIPVTNPTIATLSPATGSTAGGTVVTFTGSGFKAGATATFGGTPATSIVVASSTELQAIAPAKAAGTYNVVITNTDGGAATKLNGWTAIAPPTITSLAPTSGTIQGGTLVTITGTGFAAGMTATLDGAPIQLASTTATKTTLTTPPHAAGPVTLTVTNPDGQTATATNAYSYGAPGEPGYQQQDTIFTSTITNSGRSSDMEASPDGQTVVIAHLSGGTNQLVMTISQDAGASWTDRIPPGVTSLTKPEVFVVSDQIFGVLNGRNLYRTTDGGATFTTTALPISGLTGGGPADWEIANLGTTVVAAYNCSGCLFGNAETVAMLKVVTSTDGGATWGLENTPVNGNDCSNNELSEIGAPDVAGIAFTSATTWEVMYGNRGCSGPSAADVHSLSGVTTTNTGVSYTLSPGVVAGVYNDPINPLTNYGRYVSYDSPGRYVTFADSLGVQYVGRRNIGLQFTFTALGSTTLTSTVTKIDQTDNAAIATAVDGTAGRWFKFAHTTDSPTAYQVEYPVAGTVVTPNNAVPSALLLDCPTLLLAYQDPTTLMLKVLEVTRDLSCGGVSGAEVGFAPDDCFCSSHGVDGFGYNYVEDVNREKTDGFTGITEMAGGVYRFKGGETDFAYLGKALEQSTQGAKVYFRIEANAENAGSVFRTAFSFVDPTPYFAPDDLAYCLGANIEPNDNLCQLDAQAKGDGRNDESFAEHVEVEFVEVGNDWKISLYYVSVENGITVRTKDGQSYTGHNPNTPTAYAFTVDTRAGQNYYSITHADGTAIDHRLNKTLPSHFAGDGIWQQWFIGYKAETSFFSTSALGDAYTYLDAEGGSANASTCIYVLGVLDANGNVVPGVTASGDEGDLGPRLNSTGVPEGTTPLPPGGVPETPGTNNDGGDFLAGYSQTTKTWFGLFIMGGFVLVSKRKLDLDPEAVKIGLIVIWVLLVAMGVLTKVWLIAAGAVAIASGVKRFG